MLLPVISTNAVAAGPTSIEIFPSPQTLKVGQTSYIYAKQTGAIGGTYFYSEDKSIATVTTGELASEYSYTTVAVITAVSPGTVYIVAKSQNGIYAKCKVTVTAPTCTGISIPSTHEMEIGENWTISPTIMPATAQPSLYWKSSDTSIATVTQSGMVTALKPGDATITVTTNNGLSASCRIVIEGVEKYEEYELTLYVNQGGKVLCNNETYRGFQQRRFPEDDEVNLFILPDKDFKLCGVWLDGEDVIDKVRDDKLTINSLSDKTYIVVSFEKEDDGNPQTQGDVNKDGVVNISDVVKIINIISGNFN